MHMYISQENRHAFLSQASVSDTRFNLYNTYTLTRINTQNNAIYWEQIAGYGDRYKVKQLLHLLWFEKKNHDFSLFDQNQHMICLNIV